MSRTKLLYCNKCKEYSVVVKCYTRKDGTQNRVEFCLNKSCGYKKELPIYVSGLELNFLCEAPGCKESNQIAKYFLDGIPMCEKCKEYYRNDFIKIERIK